MWELAGTVRSHSTELTRFLTPTSSVSCPWRHAGQRAAAALDRRPPRADGMDERELRQLVRKHGSRANLEHSHHSHDTASSSNRTGRMKEPRRISVIYARQQPPKNNADAMQRAHCMGLY